MEATPTEIKGTLNLLAETPKRIEAASSQLKDNQLHLRPDEKTWSVNDILAHLRACADVWGDTIESMLAEETPTLRHLSPRTYLKKTNYLDLGFHESFQTFVNQRQALLDTLNALEFEAWSRGAIIKDRKHTVFTQARRMALHESTHCEQIDALAAEI